MGVHVKPRYAMLTRTQNHKLQIPSDRQLEESSVIVQANLPPFNAAAPYWIPASAPSARFTVVL